MPERDCFPRVARQSIALLGLSSGAGKVVLLIVYSRWLKRQGRRARTCTHTRARTHTRAPSVISLAHSVSYNYSAALWCPAPRLAHTRYAPTSSFILSVRVYWVTGSVPAVGGK